MKDRGPTALTAAEVAALTGGTLIGDGAAIVRGVAPLDRAAADQASFLADARYAAAAAASRAGTLLVSRSLATFESPASARIVLDNPRDAVARLLPILYPASERPRGIHATAVIHPTAQLGDDVTVEAYSVVGPGVMLGDRVWIGPYCLVGDAVTIGPDSRLVSHVTCYSGSVIGSRVILHAGARIASDGFGYTYESGMHQKILHVGRCIIGDDVEIGANSCIDRGSIDDTVIGQGTKIDNLVHVAHNVRIGKLCLIMAQVGIAGSSRVDDGAMLLGQAGIAGQLRIGAGARILAQAGVISDVPAGESWSGYPARPHREAMRASAALFKLAGIIRRLEELVEARR